MLRPIKFALTFVLALATLLPCAMLSAKEPVILTSFTTETTLTINGTDLANDKIRVLLGAFGPLPIVTQSPTQIVAMLPPALLPGNYVLNLRIGEAVDEASVTVGAVGPQGPVGPTGATGAVGPQGQIGITGAVGPQGLKGDKGDTGPQGLKGDVGAVGAQGLKGDVGQTGAIGPQGPVGATGAIGATGPQGLTGLTGAVGPQGLKGDKGDTGPQGLQGNVGAAGAQGLMGDAGPAGAPGLKGDKGDTGPIGPAGPAGSGSVTLATPIFTVNHACAGGGVLTLMGTCSYTLAATVTGGTETGCPAAGATNLITLTYTTPASCAAQCAGTPTPRNACVSQSQVCPGVCTSFYTRDCLRAQPTCTGTGTVNDLACNCDNVSLGHLVN